MIEEIEERHLKGMYRLPRVIQSLSLPKVANTSLHFLREATKTGSSHDISYIYLGKVSIELRSLY